MIRFEPSSTPSTPTFARAEAAGAVEDRRELAVAEMAHGLLDLAQRLVVLGQESSPRWAALRTFW